MAKLPIINQVREARTEAQLTQSELAEQVGVTRQTIAAIEQRKYSPSLEVAFKLSHVLNCSLESLFQWKE